MAKDSRDTAMFYTKPVQPIPALKQDSNIVKVGVQTDVEGKDHQLYNLDQKLPLSSIIEELCCNWEIPNPVDFALKQTVGNEFYLTEKNRQELKNGSVLKLTSSCKQVVKQILECLATGYMDDKAVALARLANFSSDPTFAQEFILQKGLDVVIQNVENGIFSGNALSNLLQSFYKLMDQGASWDIVSPNFIRQVADYVVGRAKVAENHQTLTAALAILEALVNNSLSNLPNVEINVSVDSLVRHMDCSSSEVQTNALALMNALFIKSTGVVKKNIATVLSSKAMQTSLCNSVFKLSVGAEMEHQLYVLQKLLFNMLDERRHTKLMPNDQLELEKLNELRKLVFEAVTEPMSPGTSRKTGGDAKSRDFKNLGFKHFQNPIEEFQEIPPGILAVDCMYYFAKNHFHSYKSIVLENSCRTDNHECPFATTSIALTKLLTEILKIGEPPSEEGRTYFQMFFKTAAPFMELFAFGMRLVNKTWKEMNATVDDINKVMSVVSEQIRRSLLLCPVSFENFQAELNKYPYSEIQNIWQALRSQKEESEFQQKPVIELREELKPEILKLIRLNRLNCLTEGQLFHKYGRGQRLSREKGKFWFWKLSTNHKNFHYEDCDEKTIPKFEEMKGKLAIDEVRQMVTGKDCPHVKDSKGKKISPNLAFSLLLDNPELTYNFIAPDEEVFAMWTDGISALQSQPMTSKEATQDLEMLLNMEVKIRLLDTEGIDIPNSPPLIPLLPPDFDFSYEFAS